MTKKGGGAAYLTAASGTPSTYTVTATSAATGTKFTITRASDGTVARTCKVSKARMASADASWPRGSTEPGEGRANGERRRSVNDTLAASRGHESSARYIPRRPVRHPQNGSSSGPRIRRRSLPAEAQMGSQTAERIRPVVILRRDCAGNQLVPVLRPSPASCGCGRSARAVEAEAQWSQAALLDNSTEHILEAAPAPEVCTTGASKASHGRAPRASSVASSACHREPTSRRPIYRLHAAGPPTDAPFTTAFARIRTHTRSTGPPG